MCDAMNFVWRRIPDHSGNFNEHDDARECALTSDPANAKTLADVQFLFDLSHRNLVDWLEELRPTALYENPGANWRSELWLLTDPDVKRHQAKLDFFGLAYVLLFGGDSPQVNVVHFEIFPGAKGKRLRLIPAAIDAVLRIYHDAQFVPYTKHYESWDEADILGNYLMHTHNYDINNDRV
jgi:hypothetical protein